MKRFITIVQFAELLANLIGSTYLQVISQTEPKIKKNPYFKKVLNLRDLNLQLNYNYKKQVTTKAQKEGTLEESETFEPQEHPWARHLKGALARHKDYVVDLANLDINTLDMSKLYMPYVLKSIRTQTYIADGKEVTKDALKPYFYDNGNYESQPQTDKVKVQYMKLSSVKEIYWNEIQFIIVAG